MENNSSPQPQDINQNPETVPSETPQPIHTKKPLPKKLLLVSLLLILAISIGAAFFVMTKDSPNTDNKEATESNVEAPSQENTVNEEATKADEATVEDPAVTTCSEEEGYTQFADEEFGAAFCYPTEWGTASVMDAKIDARDTGYREAVRFSSNTRFIVGGVSEDWTTTVGRDVGCQEPSSRIPELSEYNTEWNNISGSGMDVEFAQRSIAVSDGGYDITETVSNMLWSGVCTQGHKTIDGSRYRVISAAFYRDFAEASGITTPKSHIDNPTILFTDAERTQLDALLSSVVAY